MDPSSTVPVSVDLTTTYGGLFLGNVLAIGFWFLQCFQTYVDALDIMQYSRSLLMTHHAQRLLSFEVRTFDQLDVNITQTYVSDP
jgi:hypothetical protein